MPAPKKAVRVETQQVVYCTGCIGPKPTGDRFCTDCGVALAPRLVLVVVCECDPARELVGPVPDPYKIPDPRIMALHPDRFCPRCGTSTEKLVDEWEQEQAALAAPRPPGG